MARVVFQCGACRTLVTAGAVAVDAANERAGIACEACGATTWLPFAGTSGSARVVDMGAGGVGADGSAGAGAALALAARVEQAGASSTALVPMAGAQVVVADAGARFSDDQRGRIDARIAKLGPATDPQRELATGFERLLGQWGSEAEHKLFLKKASMVGELAFAGQRYRAVLEEAPADALAKKAQSDILGLAMASMSSVKDMGGVADDDTRKKVVAAAVILLLAVLVSGAIFFYLPRVLGGALDEDTQPALPPGAFQDGQNIAVPPPER